MNKFLKHLNAEVPFKIIVDKGNKIPVKYNVEYLPSTFILDKKGVVRFIHIGFTSSEKDKFTKEIEQLLNE